MSTLPERMMRHLSGRTTRLQVVDDRKRLLVYVLSVFLILGMWALTSVLLAVLPGQAEPTFWRWDWYLLVSVTVVLLLVIARGLLSTDHLQRLVIGFHLLVCLLMNSISDLRIARTVDGGTSYNYMWVCLIVLLFATLVRIGFRGQIVVAGVATLGFWLWQIGRHLTGQQGYDLGTLELMSANSLMVMAAAGFVTWIIGRMETVAVAASSRLNELGSYQLVELLGQGGMGEVWRAEHRLLAMPAAVKLVTRLDEPTALARFQREAKATAALRSSNTVRIYDYGVNDKGMFYYAMELLDGIDLDSLLEHDGPQPPARVADIMRQACASLAEAHEAGLVHRDVKPANIFLCRNGIMLDHVKLLDFGLVIANEPGGETSIAGSRLTKDNSVFGTPEFMAPEQAQALETDGRADLYALACVCFWLLTGQVPFERETAMATLIAHCQEDPPMASSVSPQPIPEAFDALLLACMQKDPEHRPRDAREVLRLLERCSLPAWSQTDAAGSYPYRKADVPAEAAVDQEATAADRD
ncbi:MAG: serine/threonine-protein kinase [Planctomycetota bacterium]